MRGFEALAAPGDTFTERAEIAAEGCNVAECRLECGQYHCFGYCTSGTCVCDCQP